MKDAASKTFVLQQDQSDCGVACLASIIKYHGGDASLEQLRKISGTSRQGTTLLGLMQAAQQIGFEAEGLEADGVHNLAELNEPAILHVVIENGLQHYLAYYPQVSNHSKPSSRFLLGDPCKGIIELGGDELDKIWQSKALLKLVPTEKLERKERLQNKKKQWIIGLIKDDLPLLLISLFLGVVIAVLGISTAIFSQKLIDNILPNENLQKLILSLVLVALLLLARSGLGYLRGLFMVRQGMDFNNRIIQSFYGNLLTLPKSFFDTRKIGELIARMNDTRRIQSVLAAISGSIVIDFLLVIVSLVFVFAYSVAIGLIMLGSLPVYFLILYFFNKPIVQAQKEVMGGYALAESNFVDTMQGVADIKLMNKQSFFEKMNAQVYGAFQEKLVNLGKLNIKFNFASEITGTFFILSAFGIASWLVLSKELKLGEMVALLGMASNVVPSATRLVIANIQIQEALVAFDRMFEFTSMEKECHSLLPSCVEKGEASDKTKLRAESETLTQGSSAGRKHGDEGLRVEVHNLSFRFPGRKQILKNVSLNIKKGEMIALLGESGGGKSTLLQLIQKFYLPENGKIVVGETNLQLIDINEWRNRLGAVPQEVKIFNGNLLYNITLSKNPEDFQQAIEFCEAKGFGKYFMEFPQGYLTLLGEEGINISGGQKQLVALARALFRNPKVLLLDEATSAMDRNTESFVLSLLQNEKSDMAILMVTHRIKTAHRCDRIYILEGGATLAEGTPKELMNSKNSFSASMAELQVG